MTAGQSAYKNPNDRRPVDVLRHEAGHMMVARLLGFKTGQLFFKEGAQAGAEIELDPDLPDIQSTVRYIESRIIVLYAARWQKR
jgi:hypothetical protein